MYVLYLFVISLLPHAECCLSHWDGFTVFEADAWGAVSLSFWFKYKELPSSVDEHLKRYAKKPLTLP